MKRIVSLLAACCLAAGAVFGLAACEHVHEWDEGVTQRAATCTEDGEKLYTCKSCNETKTEVILKTGHHYTGEFVSDGESGHGRKCADCNAVDPQTVAHNLRDEGEPAVPDGGVDEVVAVKCGDCGFEGTRTIHKFLTEVVEERVDATCKEDGVSVWKCACGEREERVISKDTVAHTWANYVKDDDETHHRVCSVCEASDESTLHGWNEGEVTTEPTLAAGGVKTYTCGDCGHTKTESVPSASSITFADGFSIENQDGSWKYGLADYSWDPEGFKFNQCTEKSNDAWTAENVEIKRDWVNAGGNATVAYEVSGFGADETVSLKMTIKFTGESGETRVAFRTAVKDSSGAFTVSPAYDDTGKTQKDYNLDKTFNVKNGDTVYLIFFNEGAIGDAKGHIEIKLSKNV